jgi:quercetin dioxygenase-like cupin family protein
MTKAFCGISLALLLSHHLWAQDTDIVKVEVLAKTGLSWDGEALPAYAKGRPEITILRITVAPKARLSMHRHPVINAGVLLKGELTVVLDDNKTRYLKAGDAIVEVVDKWHYGKNEGSEPAVIIVFYAGIKGKPLSIEAPAKE